MIYEFCKKPGNLDAIQGRDSVWVRVIQRPAGA